MLACPFCGNKPTLSQPYAPKQIFRVQCNGFACEVNPSLSGSLEMIVRKWNMRRQPNAKLTDCGENQQTLNAENP